jgi:transposase
MAAPLVPDELWAIVEPLLPPERSKPKGGRPRTPDRACLTGIIFVLKSGIQWEMLPREMNCGSGMTCWRRLRDWTHAGVWLKLQHELLNRLQGAEQIDWSRAAMDASTVPAKRGCQGRPDADESRQTGHEAPLGHGPAGHPARGADHGGQRERDHGAGATDRRHSPGSRRQARQTAPTPGEAGCRQGIPLTQEPAGTAPAPDKEPHCPTGRPLLQEAGAAPLGRRAHHRLEGPDASPGHPVRAPG